MLPKLRVIVLTLLTAAAVAACGGEAEAETPTQTSKPAVVPNSLIELDAAAAFAALESRVTTAKKVRVGFRIESSGAVESELRGGLNLIPGDRATLSGAGSFAGVNVTLGLNGSSGILHGGNGKQKFEIDRPDQLDEALLLGWTRMGLLHNLAMLTGGAAPDHAEEGVKDWVRVEQLRWGTRNDPGTQRSSLEFDLIVGGQPSGSVVLWLDAAGVPVERDQVTRFPQGEMQVKEIYDVVEIVD